MGGVLIVSQRKFRSREPRATPLWVWWIALVAVTLPVPLSGQTGAERRTENHGTVIHLDRAAPRYYPIGFTNARTEPVFDVAVVASRARRQTYWQLGAVVGGAVLGVGGFVLGYSFCKGERDTAGECSDHAVAVGAIMTFCGAIIGGLIGGSIEKGPRETAASPGP